MPSAPNFPESLLVSHFSTKCGIARTFVASILTHGRYTASSRERNNTRCGYPRECEYSHLEDLTGSSVTSLTVLGHPKSPFVTQVSCYAAGYKRISCLQPVPATTQVICVYASRPCVRAQVLWVWFSLKECCGHPASNILLRYRWKNIRYFLQ